jgi:hypothetical protein
MATNVVMFEETQMVAVAVTCGGGSLGGGTHLMQSHGEHVVLTLQSPPIYPQVFTPA